MPAAPPLVEHSRAMADVETAVITDEQVAELLQLDTNSVAELDPALRERLNQATVTRCINGCAVFTDPATGQAFTGQEKPSCTAPLHPVIFE